MGARVMDVKVKPLKWSRIDTARTDPNGLSRANFGLGWYEVAPRVFGVELTRNGVVIGEFAYTHQAKAAAQADYETRIRSAIIPPLLADALELPEIKALRDALKGLLRRDEINTCLHENTYRGGFIWEICQDCGAKWADDEGGRPEQKEPEEWAMARAAIAALTKVTP